MKEHSQVFTRAYFARPTLEVARDLLGTVLNRRLEDGRLLSAAIIEVEAYRQGDPASHAFKGPTERCRVMFGPAGHAYVYLIYGLYNCVNVVTEEEGTGAAVLIRAVDMEGGRGPGKLCETLKIDRSLNGVSLLTPNSNLWLSPGTRLEDSQVGTSVRIGISVAVENAWRFYVLGNNNVSGPKKLGGGGSGKATL